MGHLQQLHGEDLIPASFQKVSHLDRKTFFRHRFRFFFRKKHETDRRKKLTSVFSGFFPDGHRSMLDQDLGPKNSKLLWLCIEVTFLFGVYRPRVPISAYFCLRPSAKDLGITCVLVLVVVVLVLHLVQFLI